jgi:hypothetical protein
MAKTLVEGCCNLFDRLTVGAYQWKKTRFPTPGAENCAFDTLTLPMGFYIGNVNYTVFRQLHTGAEPFLFSQQIIPSGIPGIVSGQMIAQPLQGNQGAR